MKALHPERRAFRSFLEAALKRLASRNEPLQRSFFGDEPAYFSVGPACQVENFGGLVEKYIGAIDDGLYVEIGAFDGVSHSNTIGLARRGWKGILVEPHPDSVAKLRKNYAGFSSISIRQVAIGAQDGEKKSLQDAGTLSSTSPALIEHYRGLAWASKAVQTEVKLVESMRLDTLLEEESPPRFDLLVVDVEGSEREVFAGFTITKWKPLMVVVELTENHPDFHPFRHFDASLYIEILGAGYVPVFKDSINTVFVEKARYEQANLADTEPLR